MTASQPTSPTTPSRKRRSLRLSSFDVPQESSPSPYTSGTTSGTTFSRRSSRTSQTSYHPQSPVTPRPMSSRSSRYSLHRRKSSRASVNSMNSIFLQEQASGLGNLADELEQAWDEDPQGSSFLDGLREGDSAAAQATEVQSPLDINDMHDFGIMNTSLHPPLPQDNNTLAVPLSPQKSQPRSRRSTHQRTESAYDGSDYGPSDHDEYEDEISCFPPLLRKRLRDVEKLARDAHDTDALSEGGGVVKRTISAVRDLGPPQSNIEYGVTRMVTAYTSMATHRTHKQREIFALSHSLLYGNAGVELPEEFLDLLMSEIEELSSTIPFLQTRNPLLSLQILASQTSDLSQTLLGLTDLLQENRLAANAATRKLKSVRDMVDDIRVEEELVENSIMLIQAGDWDRRCRERQAGRMCRDVCREFGERWGIESVKVEVGA